MLRHKKPLQGLLAILFVGAVVLSVVRTNAPQASTQQSPSPETRSVVVKGTVYEDGIPVKDADVYCLYTTPDDPNQWKKDIAPVKSQANGNFTCDKVPALSTATEIPVVAQKGDEWCDAKATITNGTTQPVAINLDKDKDGKSRVSPEPDPKQKEAIQVTLTRVYPKTVGGTGYPPTGGIPPVNMESNQPEPVFNNVPAGYYNLATEPATKDKQCGRLALGVDGKGEVKPRLLIDCKTGQKLFLQRIAYPELFDDDPRTSEKPPMPKLLKDLGKQYGGDGLFIPPDYLKQLGYTGVLLADADDPDSIAELKVYAKALKANNLDFFLSVGQSRYIFQQDRKQLWTQEVQSHKAAFSETPPTGYFLETWEEFCGGGAKRRYQINGRGIAAALQVMLGTIRAVDPGKEIIIWGDMFSPYHNANAAYGRSCGKSDYTGSWEGLDKDVLVLNWDNKPASFAFFASKGFKQIIGGFFDYRDGEQPVPNTYIPATQAPQLWIPATKRAGKNTVVGFTYVTFWHTYNELAVWPKVWDAN